MRPTTKVARLDAIRQALNRHRVNSQQQLSSLLAEQGIDVTQATLSRDLDDLHATKLRYADGSMAYWIPATTDQQAMEAAAAEGPEVEGENKTDAYLAKILTGLITSVARARNLLVVRTPAGAAQYAASALDRQPIKGILGTIAGDDTILIIAADDEVASSRADWLMTIVSGQEDARAR